jgi:SEL1 protein
MGWTRHPVRFALAASLLLLLAAPRACDAAISLKAAENKLREQGLLLHASDSSGSRRARDADAGPSTATEHPLPSPAELKFRAARDALEGSAARFSRRKAHAVRALREVLALEPRHREAMTCLGRAYQTGEGVEQDDAEALRLFREAAALGDPGAHEELGFAHSVGWGGVEQSTAKAVLHQYFAAMGGAPLAQMAMGWRHLRGAGVPESCQSAVLYYDPPASAVADSTNKKGASFTGGGPNAANGANGAIRLTAETSTGFDGAARRDADVAQYYKYSADMGNADAASAVGRLLTFGSRGVKQDARTAYKYFTQAAAAGDADAMAHLGHMFANGIGVNEPSNETALALFRAAVDKGNARAAYGLGYMHLGGFGVDRDLQKAFEHITNAAEAGSPEAQFHLGALYARGVFGKENPKEGNAEKESENGAVRPEDELKTTKNAYARPSKRDHAKAFYNFNLAAAQGHATATYNLAIMQLSGSLGLPQTCKAAALLLKGLAERGAWTAGVEEARGALAAGRKRAGLVKYMKVAEAGVEVAQANAAFVLDRAEPWYEESTDDDDDDDARIRRRGFENKGRFSSVLGASTFGSSASASDRERRALHYHKLAADQGNVLSLLKIGDAYFYGRTGGKAPSDRSKFSTRDGEKRKVLNALDERRNVSAAVYLRATQRRSAQAMFNLGAMHEHGLGLPKDLHLAKRYYDMALSTDPKAYVPVKLALYKLQAHAWLLEKSKQSRFAAFLVRLVADVVELVSPSSSLSAETRVDGRFFFFFSANTNEEQSMDAPKHGSEYDVMALAVLTTALAVVVVARLFVDAGVLRVARAEAVLDGAEDATS